MKNERGEDVAFVLHLCCIVVVVYGDLRLRMLHRGLWCKI